MGYFKAYSALNGLCNEKVSDYHLIKQLEPYLRKQIWTPEDRQFILNTLSRILIRDDSTSIVFKYFSCILLDLLIRIINDRKYKFELFISLSKLMSQQYNDATNFAFDCFAQQIFSSSMFASNIKNTDLARNLIISAFYYLSYNPSWFRNVWNWSFIMDYIDHYNVDIKWISVQCYAILFNLDSNQYNDMISDKFTCEQINTLKLKHFYIYDRKILEVDAINNLLYEDCDDNSVDTFQSFSYNDFSNNIVSVCGILLLKVDLKDEEYKSECNVVLVQSIKQSLRLLASAVALCKPILVEGAVGCGKTMLIEYLASLTGRHKIPEITKVQMGEQVDCKILVGTYCCTDTPGNFVWKAGPLYTAMKDGNWLILEDIDSAPSDVISMLFSVIETNSLSSLPGCDHNTHSVHNQFRIFFTRRYVIGHFNKHKYSEFAFKSSHCFDKLCYVVNIDLYDRDELFAIILRKWPNLKEISDRLIDTYCELHSDDFTTSSESSSKRPISFRDLFKWCHRISQDFSLNSEKSAISAFLNANDCFIQNRSDINVNKSKIEMIGSNLNINKANCYHLYSTRKPQMKITKESIKFDRITINRNITSLNHLNEKFVRPLFADTHQSLLLMEKICVAIDNNEPILLCGETGTGKTSSVQYLASVLGYPLTVINMSQQSDCCDLLGGYKPTEIRFVLKSLKDDFLSLFALTFKLEENAKFLNHVSMTFNSKNWTNLLKLISSVCKSAFKKDNNTHLKLWKEMESRISSLKISLESNKESVAFSFIEGSLVRAMKMGEWILLDEINLAHSETLQCLSSILDNKMGSLMLLEKADGCYVERHTNFRLFACMNPATDIGKKELPLGIRNRFTEFFVDELEDEYDLRILVQFYLNKLCVSENIVYKIVNFYLWIKNASKLSLKNMTGIKPNYSLRTLCRALVVASSNPCNDVNCSIYEAFCMCFLTQLDHNSRIIVENKILEMFESEESKLNFVKKPHQNVSFAKKGYDLIEGFCIPRGDKIPFIDESYIRTETVNKNLKDLCRIVSIGKSYPILLQGETSVGKTSLILWLAKATGNVCVRVNNHEHTDLQEYIGSYCVDANGKLVFKEGVLVKAMRHGYWIILDELNLAPTEVLEALNRLLDENRELYIPETQQTVKAHRKFLLFATQNPVGHYGGRKILSRAFRNRFVELHFGEIPCNELEFILQNRCCLPPVYAKQMVEVLTCLQQRRRDSNVFAGKHGYITLRDLFRWGDRYRLFAKNNDIPNYNWKLHLAKDGFMLLAGRVRKTEEQEVIKSVIKSKLKIKEELDSDEIFCDTSFLKNFNNEIPQEFKHVVWTKSLKRLGNLLSQALIYREPVILIGETGCGKTTICQLFATLNNNKLYTVNCHMNSDSADFLGSLRPFRFNEENEHLENNPLFEWVDGPLVNAMKEGAYFMVDEISLADDSVLERLNSVLEPERTLLIAENNSSIDNIDISLPLIKAKESFQFLATMNPGGDYGKKELSPALRNRFTEIWCYSSNDISDIKDIIYHNLNIDCIQTKNQVCEAMCEFIRWFNCEILKCNHILSSIRDVLSWCEFINKCVDSTCVKPLTNKNAFFNGALLVFVDPLGSAGFSFNFSAHNLEITRNRCKQYLSKLCDENISNDGDSVTLSSEFQNEIFESFCISHESHNHNTTLEYSLSSDTVKSNITRVLRAMQLPKPILLEGIPGVGKTSLIQALAKLCGYNIIRINLSEQTDMSDLFGSDLPVEGENSASKFAFRDGPLLQALKSDSTWIILDELNLAPQSVLEGLNACLDHRGEIYIHELKRTFKINKTQTRIFGCQNPFRHGSARKGLPRSFLNRFSTIYVEKFTQHDYNLILSSMFPIIPQAMIIEMLEFNQLVTNEIVVNSKFGQRGSPWEFNLRELIRWSQVLIANKTDLIHSHPRQYVSLIYINKMRTLEDKQKLKNLCDNFFGPLPERDIKYVITKSYIQVGFSSLKRSKLYLYERTHMNLLNSQKEALESLLKCIEMNWMAILIGSSGVGKTSIVRLLADLTGNELCVLSVNSEMDNMDLLGGFEQKDILYKLKSIENQLFKYCFSIIKPTIDHKQQIMDILQQWFYIHSIHLFNNSCDEELLKKLDSLDNMCVKISHYNVQNDKSMMQFKDEITDLKSHICDKSLYSGGSFEWRDSILINALKHGKWLLIDNSNLCNSSVLDRLNCLIEPNGSLIINEKGFTNNDTDVIKPHPDFRLILAMDPINGELSAAMRNRGLEINLFPVINKLDYKHQLNEFGVNDLKWKLFIRKLRTNFNNFCEKLEFCNFTKAIHTFNFEIDHRSENISDALENNTKELEEVSDSVKTLDDINNLFDFNNTKLENELCLYHQKSDPITFTVLNDCLILNAFNENIKNSYILNLFSYKSDGNFSTALRIFIEDSSIDDYPMRQIILKDLNTKFNIENSLFQYISTKIEELFSTKTKNMLRENQIDSRINIDLWHLLWSYDYNVDKIQMMEKYLNRYKINLFWSQLKYEQSKVGDNHFSNQFSSNKIRNSSILSKFSKVYDTLTKVELKTVNKTLEMCLNNDEFIALREMLLWIHLLFIEITSIKPSTDEHVLNRFRVIWILTNNKCLTKLQSILKININFEIAIINKCLHIKTVDCDKCRQKLVLELSSNNFIFFTQEKSNLFISYINLYKRYIKSSGMKTFLLNTSIVHTIGKNIWSVVCNSQHNHELEKQFLFVEQLIENEMQQNCESDQIKFSHIIAKREMASSLLLMPLYHLAYFSAQYSLFSEAQDNRLIEFTKSLISKEILNFNPLHISSVISLSNDKQISSDLILSVLNDYHNNLNVSNIFDLWNSGDKPINLNELVTLEQSPILSMSSCFVLSDKPNLLAICNEEKNPILNFKKFLISYYDPVMLKNKSLLHSQFEFAKQWFFKLKQDLTSFELSDINSSPNAWKQEVFNSVSLIMNDSKNTFNKSVFSILVGLLSSHMLAPIYPIDPIERANCKISHYMMDLDLISSELNVRKVLSFIKYGNSMSDVYDHPLLNKLSERENYLKSKIEKLKSSLPYRPLPSQYQNLQNDVKHFLDIVISHQRIINFYGKLKNVYENNSDDKTIMQCMQESLNLQKTISAFIEHIQNTYPLYQDLINIFLIGVFILLQGIKTATFYLQCDRFIAQQLQVNSSQLKTMFATIGQFCILHSPLYIADYLSQNNADRCLSKLLNNCNADDKHISSLFLASAMYEVYNEIAINNTSESVISQTNNILSIFIDDWKKSVEEEHEKQLQNESLFEYRAKSDDPELTQDQIDKILLEKIFPTYEDLFNEANDGISLERVHNYNNKSQDIESCPESIISDVIVCHQNIILSVNNKSKSSVPNFKQSYLHRYNALQKILKTCGIFMNIGIDNDLIDGHIIMCDSKMSEYFDNSTEKSFNIYHDFSMYESNLCLNLLLKLEDRIVNELLPEFENNSALTKLLKVIHRILEFDMNSPLIKYATGLETILKEAQDWQVIAHKNIRLDDNLNEITQLVINWRKLELKNWCECLDLITKRIEQKQLIIWYFHFYSTITEIMEHKTKNFDQIKQFICSSKIFIEESKLGEFKVRLNLLYTFMIYVKCCDHQLLNNYLYISLQNLYNFYNQFSASIDNEITNQRNPVEKEVKDFVKITKWNDSNFWSLKNSVEKAHKQLYKYMKKFELSLLRPSKICFTIEDVEKYDNTKTEWHINVDKHQLFSKIFTRVHFDHNISSRFQLIRKYYSLYKKSKLCGKKCVTKSDDILNYINASESLNNQIIHEIKELSDMKVPEDVKDKEKWKKIVSHIQNRKRKRLDDLLKTLLNIGLSYRKGLIIFDKIDLDYFIMTNASFEDYSINNNNFGTQVNDDLVSCNKYFYKSIAKFRSFQTSLESPHKQLTLGTVERIKGFAAILMQIIYYRRVAISKKYFHYNNAANTYQTLLNFVSNDNQNIIIPNIWLNPFYSTSLNLVAKINAYLHRVKDFVSSLRTPTQQTSTTPPLHFNSNFPSDGIIEKTNKFLIENISKLISITNQLNVNKQICIYSENCVENVKHIIENIEEIVSDLKLFFKCENILKPILFDHHLELISQEINEIRENFNQLSLRYNNVVKSCLVVEVPSESDFANCFNYSKILVKTILKTLENVQKHFETLDFTENDDDLKNSMHLTDITIMLKNFKLKRFYSLLSKFINSINSDNFRSNENDDQIHSELTLRRNIIIKILPLIYIYMNLFEYLFTLSIASLRASNKLLNILLGLFSQLCQNGFCMPPELNDENDKNSETQLQDIRDGGFGEGEGVNDVSSKVESEDQLEDLINKDSKQDQNDDNDDNNIEEEETGIEMNDDFDGKSYSPKNHETGNESEESDEESENDEEMDDKMGDVDDHSDVMNTQFWGSDHEDESDVESSIDGTDYGRNEPSKSKIVAKDDNKNLQNNENKNSDENIDNELNEDINELQDEYMDEQIDPLKNKETDYDNKDEPLQNIPEDIRLSDNDMDNDDDNDNDNNDKINETEGCEAMSLSGESINEEKNDFDEDMKSDDESNDNLESKQSLNPEINDENSEIEDNLNHKYEQFYESSDYSVTNTNYTSDLNDKFNNCNDNLNSNESVEQRGSNDTVSENNNEQTGTSQIAKMSNAQQTNEEQLLPNRQNGSKSRYSFGESAETKAKRQRILENENKNIDNSSEKINKEKIDSSLYRHIDSEEHADNEVYDIVSDEQKEFDPNMNNDKLESKFDMSTNNMQKMSIEEKHESLKESKSKFTTEKLKSENIDCNSNEENTESEYLDDENKLTVTLTVERAPESTFHFLPQSLDSKDLINFPVSLQNSLIEVNSLKTTHVLSEEIIDAWREYETRVSPLVYELCEQLQLVLEPTKIAKMKGDYRNGKRLNMRKVIAYIASDFRKDKIWLRRTKPSKRQYQILIAVDDSLSMSDNHCKQLAFQSLALLGKSLSLIEAGELAIISFGEVVQLLHSFNEPFTDNNGAKLLSKFTFKQNQTKIAQLLQSAFSLMLNSRKHGQSINQEISQLLLIVSDGRGIYSEGEENVRQSVRQLHNLGVFIVFIIIDNPLNRESILDIRVPIFDNSGKVKIESYMEKFAFPFYVILRDINSMPFIMGESLRQWFELITAMER